MNEQQQAAYMIKGMLADAPPEVQAEVQSALERIRAIVAEGDNAKVALALAVAEVL